MLGPSDVGVAVAYDYGYGCGHPQLVGLMRKMKIDYYGHLDCLAQIRWW